jgi:hypothetical protein
MKHDLYVRAYAVPIEQEERKTARAGDESKWPQYALVFDCETRITADLTLSFGFWRFCELRGGEYVCVEEGIFHDDRGLSARERDLLRQYVRNTKPDTTDDGCDRLRLYLRSKFVKETFGMAIQAGALIVCFNAGFDLSRLAVEWETAENGGWSLIFSKWPNFNTGEPKPNKFFPRIVTKALNSKASIIHSTRAPRSEPGAKRQATLWPTARFLDVRTLLWALRNKSYSLKTGCKEFKTKHQKLDHAPTGKVTPEEIAYARNDVPCTVDLLNAAKQEFDLHPIDPGPDRMFSPASVAKSYLEKLNVFHPSEKVVDAERAYGVFMQSYFGGRAEGRIRNWEVPVCPVDFMSQYSTVNELLRNWELLTAEYVTFPDATDDVRKLLAKISIDRCFERKMWPSFRFFALVRPDDDIFPVRTVYNGTTQNIGLNYLTSTEPIWFGGPDIISSILLTGNVPHIERAIRVDSHGKQVELESTSLRGMVNVDAQAPDDLFDPADTSNLIDLKKIPLPIEVLRTAGLSIQDAGMKKQFNDEFGSLQRTVEANLSDSTPVCLLKVRMFVNPEGVIGIPGGQLISYEGTGKSPIDASATVRMKDTIGAPDSLDPPFENQSYYIWIRREKGALKAKIIPRELRNTFDKEVDNEIKRRIALNNVEGALKATGAEPVARDKYWSDLAEKTATTMKDQAKQRELETRTEVLRSTKKL